MKLVTRSSPQSQNVVAVIVKKLPLALRESAHLDALVDWNAHPMKGCSVSDGGDDQFTVTFEGDEALVEQVVNRWGKQQPVLAAQPLVVGTVPPGLDMTGDQMLASLDLGHAARTLNDLNVREPLIYRCFERSP
jgi:hypothetical protein